MAETIDIGWKVKLDGLLQGLQESGAITDKEAKKLAAALTGAFRKAENDAAKSAKNAAKEWERGLGSMKKTAEKTFSMIGGPMADLGDIVFDLSEKIGGAGSAIGGVGVAGLGAVAGIAAVGLASKALADHAVEAADRLTKQGLAAYIPDEAADSLKEYTDSGRVLSVQLDILSVVVGSKLAPALTKVTYALSGLVDSADEAGSWASYLAFDVLHMNSALNPAADLVYVASYAFDYFADAGEAAAEQIRDVTAAIDEHTAALEARKKIAAEMAEEDAFEREALIQLGLVYDDTNEKGTSAYKSTSKAAKEAAADITEAEAEVAARLSQRADLNAKIAAQDSAAAKQAADAAAFQIDLNERVKKSEEDIAQIVQDTAAARLAYATEMTGKLMDLGDTATDAIIKQAEDGTNAQKKAAKAAFAINKAAQIAAASVTAWSSIPALTLSLIPVFGPGAPAAAIGILAAELAGTVAKIAAVDPPSFERGGVVQGGAPGSTPDHVQTQAQPGEGYVTKRGMGVLGADGLERINRGEAPSGGGPTVVNLHVDGRKMATAYVDPLGSLTSGIPSGRRPLYR